jgi:hypothetical protein
MVFEKNGPNPSKIRTTYKAKAQKASRKSYNSTKQKVLVLRKTNMPDNGFGLFLPKYSRRILKGEIITGYYGLMTDRNSISASKTHTATLYNSGELVDGELISKSIQEYCRIQEIEEVIFKRDTQIPLIFPSGEKQLEVSSSSFTTTLNFQMLGSMVNSSMDSDQDANVRLAYKEGKQMQFNTEGELERRSQVRKSKRIRQECIDSCIEIPMYALRDISANEQLLWNYPYK